MDVAELNTCNTIPQMPEETSEEMEHCMFCGCLENEPGTIFKKTFFHAFKGTFPRALMSELVEYKHREVVWRYLIIL